MPYKHLSFNQRCQLSAFWKAGYSQKNIAKELNTTPSTISRELRRNRRWNGVYCPGQADVLYKDRRKLSRKPKTFTEEVKLAVKEKLVQEWSPEQISDYGKRHGFFRVSHERIYQYILADKASSGKLYLHLHQGKKKYRRRYGSGKQLCVIKNKVSIDERPQAVNDRRQLGDWEIDTIASKGQCEAIVTLVERLSKKTLIGKVVPKRAKEVAEEVISLLLPIKAYVLTITSDNGTEFSQHEWIASSLEASIYFAHPYHSWERGLNENTNGLIRQYIPKGSRFSALTLQEIQEITDRLNTRPRKSLGYATPNEVFEVLKKTTC